MRIYVIGSLRNPAIPSIANALREAGHDAVDDWFAAGTDADWHWQQYEKQRGRTYAEALDGLAARHVYDFDFGQIIQCDAAVLVAPAGKSGHLELGYFLGQGKPGHILLEPDTERWDVMLRFATGVHADVDGLVRALRPSVDDEYISERARPWTVGR
jgi:hypothetical protein